MLRSRPSAEVPAPSTPDAEVPADMAGTCGPRLLVMPSHYFEEKPQDDLPVMTSKLGLKVAECGTVECQNVLRRWMVKGKMEHPRFEAMQRQAIIVSGKVAVR